MAKADLGKVIDKLLERDHDLQKAIESEVFASRVAQEVNRWRTRSKLTLKQLAQKARTRESVIEGIEECDYALTLDLLLRIAEAMDLDPRFTLHRK
jgi:ribosome-binding protein aMBF1 (putative translation factor)